MGAISNLFGYILNFIYQFIQNYGVSIILFSILLKLILLPLSIKQQKTMKKTAKIQVKVKEIQEKYKNDQIKMNQEMMDLYKKENMSPFSGCLTSIIQIVLLFAIFGLVRNPLTYMKKIDAITMENYKNEIKQELGENSISTNYPEISIVKYVNDNKEKSDVAYINMNFLGLDLSSVPQENYKDPKVYIIPILYVLTSMLSMKISTNTTKKNKDKDVKIENIKESKELKKEEEEFDMAKQMTKNMSWFMPIMAVSISIIAPLGLALYWLVNNILMIFERIILDRILDSKEEA